MAKIGEPWGSSRRREIKSVVHPSILPGFIECVPRYVRSVIARSTTSTTSRSPHSDASAG